MDFRVHSHWKPEWGCEGLSPHKQLPRCGASCGEAAEAAGSALEWPDPILGMGRQSPPYLQGPAELGAHVGGGTVTPRVWLGSCITSVFRGKPLSSSARQTQQASPDSH